MKLSNLLLGIALLNTLAAGGLSAGNTGDSICSFQTIGDQCKVVGNQQSYCYLLNNFSTCLQVCDPSSHHHPCPKNYTCEAPNGYGVCIPSS